MRNFILAMAAAFGIAATAKAGTEFFIAAFVASFIVLNIVDAAIYHSIVKNIKKSNKK